MTEPEKKEEPPRVVYNRTLAEKWLAEHRIEDSEPAVTKQVDCAPLNFQSLPAFAYNPSIWWAEKILWLTYRFHGPRQLTTKLGIAEIELRGNAVRQRVLDIRAISAEDARFFSFQRDCWMSWVEADWDGYTLPKAVVKFGRLNTDWKLENVVQPEYGKNDGSGIEKNWVFFEWQEKLFAIYSRSPQQVVIEFDDQFKVVAEHRSDPLPWLWGTPKGGAAPVPHPNGMLMFFHSTVDNEPRPFSRRYYVGACIMEPKPPFRMIACSNRPVVSGSLSDDLTPAYRQACRHYKGRVVFPGGCLKDENGYALSAGINDSQCAILRIKPVELNLACTQ